MLTYLLIGLGVQLWTTFMRVFVRKVAPIPTFDGWFDVLCFVLVLIGGGFVNIVLWPLTVVMEVRNIVRGI